MRNARNVMTKITEMTLVFYNPAEVLLMKAALVNYKKAPFVSKQEMIILEELLDRVNEL